MGGKGRMRGEGEEEVKGDGGQGHMVLREGGILMNS